LLTPRLLVPLAVAVPLLLPLLVYQPGTGLCVPLAVVVLLLLPLLVYQLGMGLCMSFAVAVPLLLPLLVYQPGMGLYVLLAVAVLLLLLGCGGHAVQIVPLAVSGKQPVPGGDVHSSRNANRCSVLQDVHEELQGGELHRHRWLSDGPEWTLI
jgi:hypothetical protein